MTRSAQLRATLIINGLLVVGLVALTAPFVWMVMASLKSGPELGRTPATWYPHSPTLTNYRDLNHHLDLPRYFVNSTLVAVLVTVSNLLFCSMLGYALAKLRFPGRRAIFAVVMVTLMVPSTVLVIPLFVMVHKLGLADTLLGVALPYLVGPLGVFLMRQFFMKLPDSLLEAGRIDGAGEWWMFFRVALPLAGPGLATLGILTFLSSWNNFLWPQIVANNDSIYTLPVAIATFANDPNKSLGDNGMLMAGSVAVILPMLCVFLALQRYFTRSVATTGIKG